jgi:hypothetical protein
MDGAHGAPDPGGNGGRPQPVGTGQQDLGPPEGEPVPAPEPARNSRRSAADSSRINRGGFMADYSGRITCYQGTA